MREIFQPLLFLLARSSEDDLRRQNEFLKAENELLRKHVPKKRIFLRADERERLLKLGLAMGPSIRHVITIVGGSWRAAAGNRQNGPVLASAAKSVDLAKMPIRPMERRRTDVPTNAPARLSRVNQFHTTG